MLHQDIPSEPEPGRHFAGSGTQMVLDYVLADLGPEGLAELLRQAGHPVAADGAPGVTAWSSYPQFRRLLEAAAGLLGGPQRLAEIPPAWPITAGSRPGVTQMLQTLGSPSALLANSRQGSASMHTVADVDGEEVGPCEWLIRQRFHPEFDPFEEYCWFTVGLYAMTPRLFGLPSGQVVEEQCQRHGAPACVFRVHWADDGGPEQRVEYLEIRTRLLEARLDSLQRTVADLVSTGTLEETLSRIVDSAAQAVRAPAYVLALDALPAAAQRVYSVGVEPVEAERIAAELLSGPGRAGAGRMVVEVASTQARYGWLAAVDPHGDRSFPHERAILEAYGRLAAAALDSGTALEESRRQANTARVLLELSTSLTEIATTEEMAAKLASAVPSVIDCDRALVSLFDPDTGTARITATYGYPPDIEAHLLAQAVPTSPPDPPTVAVTFDLHHGPDQGEANAALRARTGSVASISAPIVVSGALIGWVTATVTADPQRLVADDVSERLHGLASQAATAIRNGRLLDQIRHQALHDGLTGLPNRVLILDRVERMLSRARRQRLPAAALFVDLDGFKAVNDTLGHGVGDQLLRAAAARLASVLRESDTIGRLGGDEFLVLVDGASLDAGPEVVAQRLLDVLREPFRLEGGNGAPLAISASIGIAAGDRPSGEALLRDADVALYAAKAAGRNRYVVFRDEMQLAVQERLAFENDLRRALGAREFFLVYQPIVDLADMGVTGVEALLRWRHPTRGVVLAEEVIPLLEETGLIVDVGRWVFAEACRQTSAWHARGLMVDLSVNVSARQLRAPGSVADVTEALARHRLDPASLIVEITESTIRSGGEATAALRALKDLGVRVAIDDFGTGCSSMSYLSRHSIDALKIDRSFIAAGADSPEAEAVVQAIVRLGRSIGLTTLAEGVENESQFWNLQGQRCGSGQGFLFAEPLEPEALEDFLATRFRPAGGGPRAEPVSVPGGWSS